MLADGVDYRKWVAQSVEVINHPLRGIPAEQVRYHVCWGSWPGPHTSDVPFRVIADLVGRENVIGSSDCGFAQGAGIQRQVPSVVWAKLAALAEGARLASRQLAAV
jgi:methionine synthase II (cobalamin-independent)